MLTKCIIIIIFFLTRKTHNIFLVIKTKIGIFNLLHTLILI